MFPKFEPRSLMGCKIGMVAIHNRTTCRAVCVRHQRYSICSMTCIVSPNKSKSWSHQHECRTLIEMYRHKIQMRSPVIDDNVKIMITFHILIEVYHLLQMYSQTLIFCLMTWHAYSLRISFNHDLTDMNVIYALKCIATKYRCDHRLADLIRCHTHGPRLSLHRDFADRSAMNMYRRLQMWSPTSRFTHTHIDS